MVGILLSFLLGPGKVFSQGRPVSFREKLRLFELQKRLHSFTTLMRPDVFFLIKCPQKNLQDSQFSPTILNPWDKIPNLSNHDRWIHRPGSVLIFVGAMKHSWSTRCNKVTQKPKNLPLLLTAESLERPAPASPSQLPHAASGIGRRSGSAYGKRVPLVGRAGRG